MASQTTNLHLKKPAYEDVADVDDLNDNMDVIDGVVGGTTMGTTASTLTGAIAEHETDITGINTKLEATKADIAYVENTDTASRDISKGWYVIWKGSSCVASADIAAGDTLSSSNLSGMSYGIANNLMACDTRISSYMAYVVNGNKSGSSIPLGSYVILRNSTISGRNDYSYTAIKAIPANTVIDSSYLSSSINKGALNDIKDSIENFRWKTVYTGSGTYSNDINVEKSLTSGTYFFLRVILFYGSIAAGNRAMFLFPYPQVDVAYIPVAYGSTYDILRISSSEGKFKIASSANNASVYISTIHGF